ncbi:FadR/GntR family transcriptional regulator [Halobacillus mangrovi]|uniref:FadR/GntR family transcriptional regulator n=1 Tax=Halobacillus mangrovi TaxID=402384 RepID=UPI0018DB7F22|nr:FadR/GntR family transcriptional regulator [Halobacillus mangrovi]
MEVEKISPKKVSELVEEQMETFIHSGKFQPGEKLPSVRELCDLFDVGRSAVRDAMTSLKGKGLVEIRHGEGMYICQFDPTKLLNHYLLLPDGKDTNALFQVREMLEAGMVKLAAQCRSVEGLEAMKLAIEEMKTKEEDQGIADYNFHRAIASASGNHILFQLMEFISAITKKSMIDFHRTISSDARLLAEIIGQHERIYEKVAAKEVEQSCDEMMAHLEYVRNLMRENNKENSLSSG